MPQGQPGTNTHTAAPAKFLVLPCSEQAAYTLVPLEQPQLQDRGSQDQQPSTAVGGLYPVSFTPSNQTECGAHMSTQPVPLQQYGGVAVGAASGGPPDSTTSSCQPTASTEAATMSLQQGSGAPATSSCGLGQQGDTSGVNFASYGGFEVPMPDRLSRQDALHCYQLYSCTDYLKAEGDSAHAKVNLHLECDKSLLVALEASI